MSNVRSWITAFRLRTLPLAFSGWIVGIAIVYTIKEVNWESAVLTLFTAFLLQILSNLANDYGDAVSGVDSEKRDGPDRMVQSGRISKEAMGKAVLLFAFLSLLAGSFLLYITFPSDFYTALVFLLLGLIAIAASIKYTVGENPYGYAGFGDLFVFVFFGPVLIFGTYYLQSQTLDWLVLLPASSIGLLSIGVLNVNNIRDIESDKESGKNSIPVRIGRKKAVLYHTVLLTGAILLALVYTSQSYLDLFQLIFLIALLPLVKNIRAVATKSSKELDPYLKQMAISTLLFSLLFSIGLVLSTI